MKMKIFWIVLAGVVSMAGVAAAEPFDPMASFDFTIGPSATPFAAAQGSGGPFYLIVGLQATDTSNGNTNTFFEEFSVPKAPAYAVTIGDGTGDDSGLLSRAGYFLSPTQIPLDDLNFNDYPPAGTSGSMFTPVPGLDGKTVSAGNGISFNAPVPEPGFLSALGAAGALVLGRLRRRNNR
jgi:hypothetical protein